MKSFNDIGIHIDESKPGEQKVPCPKCSHTRKNKNDPCLSVNVFKRTWCCHHCEWKGHLDSFNHENIIYDYCDEGGTVLYQKVRGFPKKFWQQTPDGKKSLNGVRRVLYRLPELISSTGMIFIVGGEKDVETLRKHELTATTNDNGEGNWRPDFNQYFEDRDVVILEDNDEKGRKHGKVVAENFHGIAKSIKVVRFEELPQGNDVTDYLAKSSKESLLRLVEAASIFSGSYSEYFPDSKSPQSAPSSWPELSTDALYGLAGDFVKTVEPETESDLFALLIQFLTVFGSVIGRGPYFVAEADQHFMNLFACLVGVTSKGKKGSSLGHVIRLFQMVDEEWSKSCVHSGLSSGEGLIWCIRDEIKKNRPLNRSGRVTEYQEIIDDHGVSDKRAFVVESEFASVLRVMARDGNTISAIMRNGWDGKDLKTMTKNSPAKATEPHISIIGHITKDELLRYLDRTECGNGFANRFLWVCVKRSKVLPEGGKVEESKLSLLAERVKNAVKFSYTVGEMRRDEEARELWSEVYPELSEGKPGLLGAVTGRAEAQVMRLACLFALLDLSATIKLEHLHVALALWNYCEQSAQYIFGESLGDPLADEMKRALDDTPDGMTRTELSNHFKRHKTAEQLTLSLDILIARGMVFKKEEKSDGRTLTRYFSSRHYHSKKAA
ncbi:MAG: DUF3987 domain-containing protein [Nitrospina sp.]|jgi:hypothetical protein|nr:DUF3987 domain-containing protein [Nitrospina sp.]